jgi:hyperosmotically inducible periplasmic protein
MKAILATVVCAIAITGSSVASVDAAAPQGSTAASDKALDSRIEQRIQADPSLKKFHIDVSVDAGVATLTGTVATEAERVRARRLAAVEGIARVDNKIVIDRAAAHAPTGTAGTVKNKTKDGAEKVVDKTKEGAEKAVDKTKEGLSKTGEVITDGWITTRVKSKFVGEDLLKGSDINVDTADHVVTLKGTVTSAAGRARAVQQAKAVEGVHKVIDLLTIGPKKP